MYENESGRNLINSGETLENMLKEYSVKNKEKLFQPQIQDCQ
jgi:hypothetical protein